MSCLNIQMPYNDDMINLLSAQPGVSWECLPSKRLAGTVLIREQKQLKAACPSLSPSSSACSSFPLPSSRMPPPEAPPYFS